jgi:hypothetical protein
MNPLPAARRLTILVLLAGPFLGGQVTLAGPRPDGSGSCQLGSAKGKIQHVISIVFDNVHFRRDNPNVPSDLEQMPHLLNFIESNGTLDTNHHAVLISHTANDILTSLTGVYGDRHGIPVANSYGVFKPNGFVTFPSSFFYWTDLVSDVAGASSGDSTYGMLTETGKNAPAPWVAFTRAGCDVGVFSTANIIIEATSFDVPKIFGAGSPQTMETSDQQVADFEGVGVHCAHSSLFCSAANGGVADLLPQEPGGYNGFNALFGAKYVALALGGPIRDLDGHIIVNADSGLPGFTGFDPTASQSLGYILALQKAGIPVTFAYIADVHDDHSSGFPFGPGQAGYVAALKAYDDAFAKFFTQLKQNGIDQSNTLFVVTADEGDHFSGSAPTPSNCDGIRIPCNYSQIGELDVNLTSLVTSQTGNNTAFDIHFDLAPTVYIRNNPAPTAPVTRQLERDMAKLTALNPLTNQLDKLAVALADPAEMGLLHMITSDPARTPSFTMFGPGDYYFLTFGQTGPYVYPFNAWNHGGIQPEIANTWLGLVGPGVSQGGEYIEFSDHTDIRPTMMALLGVQDDYTHDGRVLFELLDPSALPKSLKAHHETLLQLGRAYKQINAPFGQLGLNSLVVSTAALASGTAANDAIYTTLENKITNWRTQRDSIASQMKALLEGAAFNSESIDEVQAKQLIQSAEALLGQVAACAGNVTACEQ